MYTSLNRLPDAVNVSIRRQQFRDRWKDAAGAELSAQLLSAIEDGKPELVQKVRSSAPATFFVGGYDLRGLRYVDRTIQHTDNELFRNAIINYSRLRDVRVQSLAFVSLSGNFVDAVRVRFKNVTFVRAQFFGANFDDCVFEDCNFLDRGEFTNCSFKNVTFVNCFFETDMFTDCSFDERTTIKGTRKTSHHFVYWPESARKYDNKYSSGLYSGIREAYEAGHVSTLARTYLFKEKQAYTRYNTDTFRERTMRYFLEYTNGYGIRPVRVLFWASAIFVIFSLIFIQRFGPGGFLMSAGGFFTFGANTDLMKNAPLIYHFLYVFEAFLGICNTSIFIVVMTNYWSSLR